MLILSSDFIRSVFKPEKGLEHNKNINNTILIRIFEQSFDGLQELYSGAELRLQYHNIMFISNTLSMNCVYQKKINPQFQRVLLFIIVNENEQNHWLKLKKKKILWVK